MYLFSFDDSSSISSGDISDTINEISTDEGNLTGGSGHDANPYNSLKRGPKDLFRNLTNANLHASPGGKRVPNLGTSAYIGTEYMSDVPKPNDPQQVGFRKFSLQNNRLLSSDPADYSYLYNGYDQWRGGQIAPGPGSGFNQEALGQLRKLSQPDIHYRSQSSCGEYVSSDKGYPNTKCDSETNTDQSHVHEANLRKMQNMRGMQGGGVGYGYQRRPLSNTSTGSAGSSKSAPGAPMGTPVGSPAKPGSNAVGTRLAKHGLDQIAQQYHAATSKQKQEQSLAAQQQKAAQQQQQQQQDGKVPEFSSASLERRTKSTSAAQTDMEMFKSNSLGRRKGGMGPQMNHPGDNASFSSTIISNPHATYSKPDGSRHNSPYSSVHIPGTGYTGNYVPLEFAMGSPRNSASTGGWIRTNSGAVTADGRQIYHHVSDSESMDTLSSVSSINARIQQARALSSANARILAHSNYGLQRSNSMKSTRSDSAYASPQHLHHQHSEDLPSPPPPTSPTPSNSSHASSRFTFPMTSFGASPAGGQPLVRSNTSSSLPYGTPLALSKMNRGDEEDSCKYCNIAELFVNALTCNKCWTFCKGNNKKFS